VVITPPEKLLADFRNLFADEQEKFLELLEQEPHIPGLFWVEAPEVMKPPEPLPVPLMSEVVLDLIANEIVRLRQEGVIWRDIAKHFGRQPGDSWALQLLKSRGLYPIPRVPPTRKPMPDIGPLTRQQVA
jgi:hypothetical protein